MFKFLLARFHFRLLDDRFLFFVYFKNFCLCFYFNFMFSFRTDVLFCVDRMSCKICYELANYIGIKICHCSVEFMFLILVDVMILIESHIDQVWAWHVAYKFLGTLPLQARFQGKFCPVCVTIGIIAGQPLGGVVTDGATWGGLLLAVGGHPAGNDGLLWMSALKRDEM